MRKSSIILILSFSCLLAFGQTPSAVKLADSLLKEGTFIAAVTTYDFPEEIKILQAKALKSLKKDPEWANKYVVVQIQDGHRDLRYLDAFGLSKQEFTTMLAGFKEGQVPIFSDTSQISIKKRNGLITFQTSQALSLFNYLRINTNLNTIFYDNLKVTRELFIEGKFYAPILRGVECHMSEEIKSMKPQTDITYFGFSIGNNKNDLRPTVCLIHGKPPKDQSLSKPQFLVMTIM